MGLTMGHFGLKHTRDRLAGDQLELTRRKQKLLAQIAALEQKVTAIDAQLQANADNIRALDTALQTVFDDQRLVAPRQTFPKKHFLPWGGITRGALAILREAKGSILTTAEIAARLASQANLELPTNQDVRGFHRVVRQRLGYLSNKGVIERLHELKTQEDGQWRLKGSSA